MSLMSASVWSMHFDKVLLTPKSSVHAKPLFFLWSVPDKALGCISEECRFGNGKLWSVTEILDQKANSMFLTNHGNV